ENLSVYTLKRVKAVINERELSNQDTVSFRVTTTRRTGE
ncbi:unnamed protein product, partial [marine sediment metagenome]